jgi:hypothetical protein
MDATRANVPRTPNAPAAGRGSAVIARHLPAPALVSFRLATPADDAGLRRLLRDNPMAGDVRLSLEREPSYFAAAAIEGPAHHTIVAVEGGRIVGAGGVSARLRYVNGRPAWVGYLGGLRLDAGCRHRMSIVRGGYAMFRKLHEQGCPPTRLGDVFTPSPGTPGEGWGGGRRNDEIRMTNDETKAGSVRPSPFRHSSFELRHSALPGPLPNPPPEYRGGGKTPASAPPPST